MFISNFRSARNIALEAELVRRRVSLIMGVHVGIVFIRDACEPARPELNSLSQVPALGSPDALVPLSF